MIAVSVMMQPKLLHEDLSKRAFLDPFVCCGRLGNRSMWLSMIRPEGRGGQGRVLRNNFIP